MSSQPAIRTIFFDVGGTLLRAAPSVGGVYSRTAAEHGWEVDAGYLNERFRGFWKESLERSRGRGHCTSDAILRQEWFTIVRDTFGDSVPASGIGPLFEDLYRKFVSASAWTLAPGARETLEMLKAHGVRLGILSNWDSRLPGTLEQLDIAGLFDLQVISFEVGYEKPHAKIFAAAAARAQELPECILHVGDSWETDIRPARESGMRTIWMARASERSQQQAAGPGAEDFTQISAGQWENFLT